MAETVIFLGGTQVSRRARRWKDHSEKRYINPRQHEKWIAGWAVGSLSHTDCVECVNEVRDPQWWEA